MNRIIVVGAVVLGLGSGVAIHAQQAAYPGRGQGVVLTMPLETRAVKGLPYSAEIEAGNTQTLADGNRIVQRTTGRIYRDSDGRVRREEDRPSGGPTVSITDPFAGTTFILDPVNRTARERPAGPSTEIGQALAKRQALLANKAAKEPAAENAEKEDGRDFVVKPAPAEKRDERLEERLPDRVIEGVLASGVRITATIKQGAIGNEQRITVVSEEWMSPDLQVVVMTDRRDPRTGHSTYRLLNINRLDPDPALFQVPADYTVQRLGR
jgi:hypothetical protein